jgi:hypothetical protein
MDEIKRHLKSTLEGRGNVVRLDQKYLHYYFILSSTEQKLFIQDISVRLYERYHSMKEEDFVRYLTLTGIDVSYDQITDIFKIL